MNSVFVKKFFITITIVLILFTVTDFIAYTADWYGLKNQNEKYNTYLPEFNYSWHLDRDPYSYILQKNTYRAPLNIHSNLEPIYIFGCSFAYGEHLFEKDTFGAQLAKLTNRPVYNFAFPGFGVQHMLFQLENMTMPSSKAPKYIIYVYIHDHLRRLSTQFIQPCQLTRYPLYIEKNNDLIFKKFKSFSPAIFYIYRKIQGFWAKYSAPYKLNLLDKHFIKAYKYMKKMYPDTEFIILIYNPAKEESKYNLENLHKLGIKTIFTSELTSDKLEGKYILPDSHPSALAWQVLTPRFIEELSK